jgi:cyclopropane fatty-acyl-phospholipid synthase-like methyltransferase
VNRGDRNESADTASSVRAYYEGNTRLFLALGIGWRTLSMRRAVWADGVESLSQAVDYVNRLVASEAESRAAAMNAGVLRILDIGCGVGGSLFFLAGAIDAPMEAIGITISPTQAGIARRQARIRGLSTRCVFLAADFIGVTGLPPFHLACAIESFVHFPSPSAFFTAAAASLAPGGRLLVIDDFISRESGTRRERRLVEAFRHGWLLPSLCPLARAARSAAACGLRLVEDRDLSGSLSPHPLGARMSGWTARVARALPVPGQYWRSTVGSLALSSCQQAGLVGYHCLVFEKAQA